MVPIERGVSGRDHDVGLPGEAQLYDLRPELAKPSGPPVATAPVECAHKPDACVRFLGINDIIGEAQARRRAREIASDVTRLAEAYNQQAVVLVKPAQ
jgi:hypothetical protein